MRTIEGPDEVAEALEERARRTGLPLGEVLRVLSALDEATIRSHPEAMGGHDCVRNTRTPVWLLVSAREQGQTDADVLESYPQLTALDLSAAWVHFVRYPERILAQSARHKED